jgi:hypothetical protein
MSGISYAEALTLLSKKEDQLGSGLDRLVNIVFSETTASHIIESLALYYVKKDNLYLFEKAIMSKNININFNKNILFRTICKLNRVEMYKLIIKNNSIDLNDCEGKALLIACSKNNIEIVKRLINSNEINLFARNGKAFRTACNLGFDNIANLFLEKKEFNDNIDKIYFDVATSYLRNKDSVFFIDYINNLNFEIEVKKYEELFRIATKNNNYIAMEFLLSKNININCYNGEAFIEACEKSNIKKLNFLYKYESLDLNIRQDKGIRFACQKGNLNLVKYLLNKGLCVEKYDLKALKLSIQYNEQEVYDFLLYDIGLINKISTSWIDKNIVSVGLNKSLKEKLKMNVKVRSF